MHHLFISLKVKGIQSFLFFFMFSECDWIELTFIQLQLMLPYQLLRYLPKRMVKNKNKQTKTRKLNCPRMFSFFGKFFF